MDELNMFILLELECNEKDPVKINAAMEAKKAIWSRNSNQPLKAQRNRELTSRRSEEILARPREARLRRRRQCKAIA